MKLAERFNYLYMLRTCWGLADRQERRQMVCFYTLGIGANLVGLAEPLILAKLVETITRGGSEILHSLLFWAAMWLVMVAGFCCFNGPSRIIERKVAYALRGNMTKSLYTKVSSLPWEWHQNHHSGGVISQVNMATQSIYDFAENQFLYLQLFVNLTGSIVVLLWLAPGAGITMAISLPLLVYTFQSFDKVLAKLSQQWNLGERETAASITDYLGNIATVLTLRLQLASGSEIMRRFSKIKEPLMKSVSLNEAKWCSYGLLLRVIQSAALIGFVWQKRNIDPAIMAGTAVAILQYLRSISTTFFQSATLFQSLIKARVNVEIAEFLSEAATPRLTPVITSWRTAVIDNLTFSYQDRDRHAQHLNVSLDLARGRRIALVGTSGSGKSTLLRLLRGLHEADGGTLTIDGTVYQGIAPLADLSTLVPQDPEIFENTIRYNITCGIAEDEAALNAAIHAAALESVIAELPQGIDTDIRERGVNLSGGQKQRLALARGILAARDSSLILLDEPTSSLDAATESIVFTRMFEIYCDACIVASLHRLHLLERFDYVYVMEAGRIVEEGSFAELVSAGGVLSHLWKAQQAERSE